MSISDLLVSSTSSTGVKPWLALSAQSLACAGTISAAGVSVAGYLAADGSASSPAYSFASAPTTGLYRSGAAIVTSIAGASVSTASAAGTTVAGTLGATGALSSASLTTGTVGATDITCTSVASTGAVTQPRYAIRLWLSASQTIASTTTTLVLWNAIETAYGGATNWSFVPPSGLPAVPVAGRYMITLVGTFAPNVTGSRNMWVEINPTAGVPGSTRRYMEVNTPSSGSWSGGGTTTCQLAAGDVIAVAAFQGSGGGLNLLGNVGTQASQLTITRLSE